MVVRAVPNAQTVESFDVIKVTNGIVKGIRREGTLLTVPSPRLTKPSRFLRKLERLQGPQPLPAGVTPLHPAKPRDRKSVV